VQTIVRLITDKVRSKLETVRAIWMWLCHNIQYDVDGFLGLSPKIHTPEQVLQTRRGVCSGYAHLCREMCREAGLSCIEVSGHGRGTGYQQGLDCQQKKPNHMWNAVQLEGQWHLLDACWGAGIVDEEKRLFIPRHDDFFFLTDPEHFIETHWPEEPQGQLVQPRVSLEDFEQSVFKTSEFFKLQLSLLSPNRSLLRTGKCRARTAVCSYRLYKLCSDGSKEELGMACGMLMVSEKRMTLQVLPPTEGFFELMVFARPSDAQNPYSWVCSYQIKCLESSKKDLNELFPSGLSMHCGTGISTRWRGFSNPSHPAPIIHTNQGKCNITFHTRSDTEVAAVLSKDKVTHTKYPLERYVLLTHLANKVSVCILLPESGLYKVGLFRQSLFNRSEDHKDFAHVCDYVVRCFSEPRWLPFPRVYSTWRRGCILLQPRTGVLQERSWIRFRVKMPKAYRAFVVGQARTELQPTPSKIWEGEVYTGFAGTELKLAAKFCPHATSMEVILSFDVEGS
uniref:Transglutaminase-like domain-containing protein n=1 Tax=Pelodiscus sinensis TaxID=13735 RepID=K7FM53_PELSI